MGIFINKQNIMIPFLSILLIFISPISSNLSYFILAAWALSGRQQAIMSLFTTWFINTSNTELFFSPVYGSAGRYIVIMGVIITAIINFKGTIKAHILFLWFLGGFLIFHAIAFSVVPEVSILKSLLFISTLIAMLSLWGSLSLFEKKQTERFIFSGLILIFLTSLLLYNLDIGYVVNGTGFQGLLNHPQSFGPFVAILLAYIIGNFLTSKNNFFWYFGLIILCSALIFSSESRTAGGAIFLALFISVLFFLFLSRQKIISRFPRLRTKKYIIFFSVLFFVFLIFSNNISSNIQNYLLKSNTIIDSHQENSFLSKSASSLGSSRQEFYYEMLTNIKKTPLTGIGFGVASNPSSMNIVRDPLFNLAISAPIEKGIMPVALLEELGLPGAFIVFSWFFILIRLASIHGVAPLFVLTTMFTINLGENIFFSTGGMGLLLIVLTTWAVTKDQSIDNNPKS